ncbi:hypothetical protein CONCODRAFT_16641 [Conidiobolus coronatus NRRL 28638]|uniref:Uncharacterized protein n=1 Tax=Conidiobolus coronatus (strain ATCC 28846 / CBS 209.66 / NRRL 28638) TaxID=796925 RepID=A0A137PA02_CONC2|nr:hypothetical protein CONCODRAFT_16641 [Conidiobolus coronatus NRRL 28638]|eukprot:KXN71827.1 hypothetical protein CONCODRAFT_16641 [Conidiobolus coronatus NRRL 28638]
MSLNVSSRSNLSNPSYNPNLIKYDKNLLKSNNLHLLSTKKFLKTYSYKSDETEEFISNVLSENWIDSVKQYNLENLGEFSNNLTPINFEDFKFQNLKERIKIIEIRNRKNSTQSSKTLNQIGSDNLFDKIDTTLEDSIDRSSSLKCSTRNSFTNTKPFSKKPVNNLSSESLKTQQKHASRYVFESKSKFSTTDYKKSVKNLHTEGKILETKISPPKPSTNFVNISINEIKKNSKILMNRPLYRVPKYGPLKLSSQELSPEIYSNKNKTKSVVETKSESPTSNSPLDHKFDPYSMLSKPKTNEPEIETNDHSSNLPSSSLKSFIAPPSSQPSNSRPTSYPQSNISSISTDTSKISINIDDNDRTALKLKYINKFKNNDNSKLSSELSCNNKTSLQDKMSVIFTDKPKPCLVLSDYSSSSSDSLNFTQDLPQFLKEVQSMLNFDKI